MPPVQTLEEPVEAKDGELCNILLDALINIGSGHPAVVQAAEGMPVLLFVIDFVFRRWVINFNCEVGIYRESNKERIEQHTAFSHTRSNQLVDQQQWNWSISSPKGNKMPQARDERLVPASQAGVHFRCPLSCY